MAIKEEVDSIKKKVDDALKENSFAMEMIHFAKENTERNNKRQFTVIIVLILALIVSVSYNVYLLNNVETETTITKSVDIKDIDNLEDSEISNK